MLKLLATRCSRNLGRRHLHICVIGEGSKCAEGAAYLLFEESYNVHRQFYMSAYVLLNLLNELGKKDKL